MTKNKKVVIIGAGAGGMASAAILAKAGYDVEVYEKNSGPGGRMDVLKKDGFTFDTGPSWYLMKDVFEDFFKLFGKSTKDYYKLTRLHPAYKVFYDYRDSITIEGNYKKNKKIFESIESGSGKELDEYLSLAQKSYSLALKYFLYNPYTRVISVFNKEVIKSASKFFSLFVSNLHRYISIRFKSLALQQILEYPSVFLGASPFNTPSLYQLMSYLDFKEGVFYPSEGGMYEVTKSLYQVGLEQGVKYHFSSDVNKILVEDGRTKGIVVNGKEICSDIVISNADLHFTETKLLEDEYQTYPEKYWQKKKPGPSGLLLYLGVKGKLLELEHHNLFFTEKWQENFNDIYKAGKWPKSASMYVSRTSATDKTVSPKGNEALFVLVPLPAKESIPNKDLEKYVDNCIDNIANQAGIKDLKDRIVLKEVRTPEFFKEQFNSWQYTALGLSHTFKQSAFLRPKLKSKKVKNLYYVGAGTQPGIGVPMCVISAQVLYKIIANDSSPSPLKKIREL